MRADGAVLGWGAAPVAADDRYSLNVLAPRPARWKRVAIASALLVAAVVVFVALFVGLLTAIWLVRRTLAK